MKHQSTNPGLSPAMARMLARAARTGHVAGPRATMDALHRRGLTARSGSTWVLTPAGAIAAQAVPAPAAPVLDSTTGPAPTAASPGPGTVPFPVDLLPLLRTIVAAVAALLGVLGVDAAAHTRLAEWIDTQEGDAAQAEQPVPATVASRTGSDRTMATAAHRLLAARPATPTGDDRVPTTGRTDTEIAQDVRTRAAHIAAALITEGDLPQGHIQINRRLPAVARYAADQPADVTVPGVEVLLRHADDVTAYADHWGGLPVETDVRSGGAVFTEVRSVIAGVGVRAWNLTAPEATQ